MSAQTGEAATSHGPLTRGAERSPGLTASLSEGSGARVGYRLPPEVHAELDRRALGVLLADVLAVRECGVCEFSGPVSEFIAFGQDDSGTWLLVHREGAPEGFALICLGCASLVGRLAPSTLVSCLEALAARLGWVEGP